MFLIARALFFDSHPGHTSIPTFDEPPGNQLIPPEIDDGYDDVENSDVFAIFLGLALCTLIQRPPGSLLYRTSSTWFGRGILYFGRLIPVACFLDSVLIIIAIGHEIKWSLEQNGWSSATKEKKVLTFLEHVRNSATTIQLLRNPECKENIMRPVDAGHNSKWTQLGKSELALNALAACEMSLVITKLVASEVPIYIYIAASVMIANWGLVEVVYMCFNMRSPSLSLFEHDDLEDRTKRLDKALNHFITWAVLSMGLVGFLLYLGLDILHKPPVLAPWSKEVIGVLFGMLTVGSSLGVVVHTYGHYLWDRVFPKHQPKQPDLEGSQDSQEDQDAAGAELPLKHGDAGEWPRDLGLEHRDAGDWPRDPGDHPLKPEQEPLKPEKETFKACKPQGPRLKLSSITGALVLGTLYTCLFISSVMAYMAKQSPTVRTSYKRCSGSNCPPVYDLHLKDVLPFPLMTCVLSIWLVLPGFPLKKWTGMDNDLVRDSVLFCNLLSSGLCSVAVLMLFDTEGTRKPDWLNWIP